MSYAHPKIGNRDVFYSGTLIFHDGQTIKLFPFEDDQAFVVEIKLDLSEQTEEPSNSKTTVRGGEDESVITFERAFSSGAPVTSKPLNFAEDEDWQYYCAVSFVARGRLDRYSVVLSYTFTRERNAQ